MLVVLSLTFYVVLIPDLSVTENKFTHEEMPLMLGVSKQTAERKMTELQLSNKSRYTDIEDDMLDCFVQRIINNFPRSGNDKS